MVLEGTIRLPLQRFKIVTLRILMRNLLLKKESSSLERREVHLNRPKRRSKNRQKVKKRRLRSQLQQHL